MWDIKYVSVCNVFLVKRNKVNKENKETINGQTNET